MSSEPISATGLAGRYATALFDLAEERKALDQVAGDLTGLQGMIAESPDLQRLLRSPVIGREDQERALDAVLEKAGVSRITRNFASIVARNRRLFALNDMARAYRALLASRRGEATAEVTSAHELTGEQLDALRAALKKSTGADVAVSVTVDPELIGGLIVRIGSRMIDSSLRTKLQKLQFVLKGAA